MKTLVVVDLNGRVVSLMLSDLTSVPVRGSFYVFDGTRFEVTETIEFLGFRTINGQRLSGMEKMMEVMKVVYGEGLRAMSAQAGMTDIGYTDEAQPTTSGGIILPEKQVERDFDHVLFVRAKPAAVAGALPTVRLNAAVALDGEQQLVDGDASVATKAHVDE
ncbi:MAG: hypothetical protein K2W95_32215 [Candidatus Obscuribacterales bacterium]|nr:hypothetical protein [Candidatus Obscuribacterales bacterium]